MAIVYLATSTGAMVNMHYCMGKLANWGVGNDDSKTCGKCGMEKKSQGSCCQDEHRFLKSSSDQKISESSFNYGQAFIAVSYVGIAHIYLPDIIKESFAGHDPPLHHGVSIYILTCDYRI